ncbi:MAG: hypothetical protein WD226_12650 [Planctomycetota bacterium]
MGFTAATSHPSPFEVHFETATRALRSALIELLSAAGAETDRPQVMSRHFGLNKNLTWKLTKIVHGTDAFAWAPHVPGRGGLKIALDAIGPSAGAKRRSAVETAFDEFEAMVQLHAGDRTNLELLLGNLRPDALSDERLETSRKLAFQGNSAIWGVQARLRFGLQMDCPNEEDPSRVDIVKVGGILGFRRLRPISTWPLARVGGFGGDNTRWEPIDQVAWDECGVPLMREFCSQRLPEIHTVPIDTGNMFELGPGPVGNAAEVSCVFGAVQRAFAPIYADAEGDVGEHYLHFDGPLERGIFDMLVHKDLPVELPPRPTLFSMLHGRQEFPLSTTTRFHLPLHAEVQELGNGPPHMATPHMADYAEIVDRTCRKIGRSLDEFRGYRVEIAYPPIPSILVLHYPLAPRPSQA